MERLNNKGMTAVELLITFTILSVVVVGLFDMTLNYKDKEQQETTKSSIIDYENKLEKMLQDDFIKGHLVSVSIDDTAPANIKRATFKMNKPEYRKNDIEDYNESLDSYTTTLSIDFDTGVVSYGITGKEISYSPPKFGANNKVTINKDKTVIDTYDVDNSFVNIDIAFSYTDIDDNDIFFSMTSPIDYPLNLDNRDILTGTVTINDRNSWDVVDESTELYTIREDDEYVKIKIKNTSDANLYYSFYYIATNTLNIPENGKKPGYITETDTTLDFKKGVFISAGEEKTFYLNMTGIKGQTMMLGLTISTTTFINTRKGIYFFEKISNLAGMIKFKAYLSNSLNKDENTTFIAGDVDNNYVWYSGHLWRAVAIDNSTDSLKLVTEQPETFISYGKVSQENPVPSSDSNISKFLTKFYDQLRNTSTYTLPAKYNYSVYSGSGSLQGTSLIDSNVGLLSAYEYLMTVKNSSSYLNKNYKWYTISTTIDSSNEVYVVEYNKLNAVDTYSMDVGVRPTITLKSSVANVDRKAQGTISRPYMIEDSWSIDTVNDLASGDYVTVRNGRKNLNFRVVSKAEGERLLKVVFPDNASAGFAYSLSSNSSLYYFLNKTFYNSLPTNVREGILADRWDTTTMTETTPIDSYNGTMSQTVGLLKVGDLLSGYCEKSCCMLLTPDENDKGYAILDGGTHMSTISWNVKTCYAVPVTSFDMHRVIVNRPNYGTYDNPVVLQIN